MISVDGPLFVSHPSLAWSLDLSTSGLTSQGLDALPWTTVFSEMAALEAGSIANADENRQVGHYWLRAPDRAPTLAIGKSVGDARIAVLAFARGVRDGSITAPDGSAFTDVIHIGIGGSALGPMLLVDALGDARLRMHFVDNLDPDGIARTLASIADSMRTTLIVVVSKSGGTAETRYGMELTVRSFREQGLETAGRLVAITGSGSKLDTLATQKGWLARFPMWDWVGGRFSVTSAVGLLPGALAGIDMGALLDGAAAMDDWTRTARWPVNPAAALAGAWYLLGDGIGDRAMVTLPYNDRLVLFSRYLQQLIMESVGKRLDRQENVVHQGLTVFGNKGSTDQHSFVQQLRDGRDDFFAVLIQVLSDGAGDPVPVEGSANAGDVLQGFLLGTRRALRDSDRPVLTLTVPCVDATVLGGLIALFERATGLYATLIDVNAYHQPGVEAGKLAATEIVALQDRVLTALSAGPTPLAQLQEAFDGELDPFELWSMLERFQSTGRARRAGTNWTR